MLLFEAEEDGAPVKPALIASSPAAVSAVMMVLSSSAFTEAKDACDKDTVIINPMRKKTAFIKKLLIRLIVESINYGQ
jgi:hypothetical protein